jgi:hypothetical protein
MSIYQVEITCNGEIMSSEPNEFPSIWRAFSETVHDCPPYGLEYKMKKVKLIDGRYEYVFDDGTIIRVWKLDA